MPQHLDPNGGLWEVTIAGSVWLASLADNAEIGYPNKFADIDDDRNIGGKPFHLTWAFNREPSLSGKLANVQPKDAIDGFARQNRAGATILVQGKVPTPDQPPPSGSGSLVALLLIVAIIYFADDGKRR